MNNSLLKERSLYRSDPVAYFLVEKLRCSSNSIIVWSITVSVVLSLLTALLSNTLWSKPGQVGLLQDWVPWIAAIVINPVVFGYYLWSFRATRNVIQNLETSDVVEIDELEIEPIISTLYHQKWRSLLALASGISFSTFVFSAQTHLEKSWGGSGYLPNLSISVATLIVVYVGSMLILNLINNIQIFHRIFKEKKLNVNPLHPDRSGGLRSLSDYSLKTAYLISILGVWTGIVGYQIITQGSKQDYWYLGLMVLLYIVLSITCFFGPLLTAHRGMEKAKEDLLHEIARQFESDYSQIRTGLTEDAETLKKRTEKIRELRAVYTMTDEFPVWPFNVQTFRRYLLTVPAPLLAPLLGLLQKVLGLLLKKWGISLG
ncbi:MAG: hypothetical protein KME42_05370 [Tildeniella nuda ZEHNDER 1965/U140]|jgi:hypothetical protein|nr:hypothetical protein [Tildeniella nuda ZEHNDER 1965/U140]